VYKISLYSANNVNNVQISAMIFTHKLMLYKFGTRNPNTNFGITVRVRNLRRTRHSSLLEEENKFTDSRNLNYNEY